MPPPCRVFHPWAPAASSQQSVLSIPSLRYPYPFSPYPIGVEVEVANANGRSCRPQDPERGRRSPSPPPDSCQPTDVHSTDVHSTSLYLSRFVSPLLKAKPDRRWPPPQHGAGHQVVVKLTSYSRFPLLFADRRPVPRSPSCLHRATQSRLRRARHFPNVSWSARRNGRPRRSSLPV